MPMLFAYGILKNEGILVKENYEIKATMFDLGAFPAITKLGSDDLAIGNLLKVSHHDIEQFDIVEGVPHHYTREVIDTEFGKAFIYVYATENIASVKKINIWNSLAM